MNITIDKYFIEKLNSKHELHYTYDTFKKFYIEVVKPYRQNSPEWQKKQRTKNYGRY